MKKLFEEGKSEVLYVPKNTLEVHLQRKYNEDNVIPTIHKKSLKNLGRCYSLQLTDCHQWQYLLKQLKDGLLSTDKYDLIAKDELWYVYFGLILRLAWPMQIYEVSLLRIEKMERLINKCWKNGWGFLNP